MSKQRPRDKRITFYTSRSVMYLIREAARDLHMNESQALHVMMQYAAYQWASTKRMDWLEQLSEAMGPGEREWFAQHIADNILDIPLPAE